MLLRNICILLKYDNAIQLVSCTKAQDLLRHLQVPAEYLVMSCLGPL